MRSMRVTFCRGASMAAVTACVNFVLAQPLSGQPPAKPGDNAPSSAERAAYDDVTRRLGDADKLFNAGRLEEATRAYIALWNDMPARAAELRMLRQSAVLLQLKEAAQRCHDCAVL